MPETMTAEQMVLDALKILQRGLPPGDLDDRQVIAELWGIFDNPSARLVINTRRPPQRPLEEKKL